MTSARLARGIGFGIGLDLLVILAAGAAPGFAQATTATVAPPASGVPSREGNVWDHVAHQPTAAVGGAERHAGVAPTLEQARHEDEELARINRQLQQQNGVKNPPPGP
jgi:hypothetical protein